MIRHAPPRNMKYSKYSELLSSTFFTRLFFRADRVCGHNDFRSCSFFTGILYVAFFLLYNFRDNLQLVRPLSFRRALQTDSNIHIITDQYC